MARWIAAKAISSRFKAGLLVSAVSNPRDMEKASRMKTASKLRLMRCQSTKAISEKTKTDAAEMSAIIFPLIDMRIRVWRCCTLQTR